MTTAISESPSAGAGAALEPIVAMLGDPVLVRRAESVLLRQGIEVIACVERPEDLEELSEVRHPHVLVLVSDDQRDDAGTMRTLGMTLPQTRIVAVLRDSQSSAVRAALRAGADGVVTERQLALALPAVVRAVSLGHAVVPLKDRSALGREPLSPREREVLALAADGLTNAAIAARLHLAESTVKSHLSSGFAKLGIHSRSDLPALIHEGRGRRAVGPRSTELPGGNA